MSRPYNPQCTLEQAARDVRGGGTCSARSPGEYKRCTAPAGHGGHAHVSTGYSGRVIVARWTEAGAWQEAEEAGWQDRLEYVRDQD